MPMEMLELIKKNKYVVRQLDGAKGMILLPNKSVKLIYGSPPILTLNEIMAFGRQASI